MNDKELMQLALGIKKPWYIEKVTLDLDEKRDKQ